MIQKIFYSLVLFPHIKYEEVFLGGWRLKSIKECEKGTFKIIFSNSLEESNFLCKHIDYKDCDDGIFTKNWQIFGEKGELLDAIFKVVSIGDSHDFNFMKSKEFYYDKPFGTVLNITSKCNIFCNYCFNDYDYPLDTRNKRKTLGLEHFKDIIDELYESGTRDVILTGGEPFTCSFLWEILEYLKHKNIFIRINTNGTLLSDTTLKRINEDYSLVLMVSMHEFNNKDYFDINRQGAANIYNIQELKKWENKYDIKIVQLKKIQNYNNITLDFLTILTPKNIIYLEEIYVYVLKNFVIKDWHFFRLFSTGTTKGISKSMITLAIHKLDKLNKKFGVNFKIVDSVPFCVTKHIEKASKVIDGELSSRHNVKTIITAEGNIQIMSAFDCHLGNIFKEGIKDVWKSEFVQKKLTNQFLPEECADCKYKEECMGGSRMDANIFNGSYDALDPLCNLDNKVT